MEPKVIRKTREINVQKMIVKNIMNLVYLTGYNFRQKSLLSLYLSSISWRMVRLFQVLAPLPLVISSELRMKSLSYSTFAILKQVSLSIERNVASCSFADRLLEEIKTALINIKTNTVKMPILNQFSLSHLIINSSLVRGMLPIALNIHLNP